MKRWITWDEMCKITEIITTITEIILHKELKGLVRCSIILATYLGHLASERILPVVVTIFFCRTNFCSKPYPLKKLNKIVIWALITTIFYSAAAEDVTNSTEASFTNKCNNATCQFSAPPVEAMSRLLPSTGDGIFSNDTRHSSATSIDIVTTPAPTGLSAYSKFAQTNDKSSFAPSPFLGIISEVKTHAQGISVGEILPDTIGGSHITRPKQGYFGGYKPLVLQSDLKVVTAKPSAHHSLLLEKTPELKQDQYQQFGDISYNLKNLKDNGHELEIKSHADSLLHSLQESSQLKQNDYQSPDLSTYNVKDIIDFQKNQEIRGKPDIVFHQTDVNHPELKQSDFHIPGHPSLSFKDLKQYKYQQNVETRDKPDSFFDGLDALYRFKGNDYRLSTESVFKQPQNNYKGGDGYSFERPIGVVDTNNLPEYQQPLFKLPGSIKPIKEETYDIDPKYAPRPPTKSYGVTGYEGHHSYENEGHHSYGIEGHHSYENTHVQYHDDSSYKWKSVFRFLATVIPFGILVAALSPSILVVNPTESPEEPGKIKYRSLEAMMPNLKDSLLESDELDVCQKRKLCDAIIDAGSAKFQPYIRQLAKKSKGSSLADVFGKASKNKCSEFDCT